MTRKIIQGLAIGLLSAAFGIALWFGGWLNWLESASWDFRVRQMARPGKFTDRIVLIMLDQYSLDYAKEHFKQTWPWDRSVYSYIIDFCKRGGAKSVIFDVLFTEPSRIGAEEDEILGSAIASNGSFVAAMDLSKEQGTTKKWPPDIRKQEIPVEGIDNYLETTPGGGLRMPLALFPIPEIATNCAIMGNVFNIPDDDGKTRRVYPFQVFDNQFVPSLGIAAFLAANPGSELSIKHNTLATGQYQIPLDSSGKSILKYRGTQNSYKIINAVAVLNSELRLREGKQSELDPSILRDMYVFFGGSAPGLFDITATPVSRIYPGTAIHVTALDNLLSNDFIRNADTALVTMLVIILSIAAGITGRFCQTGTQISFTFVVFLPIPMLLGCLAYAHNIWLHISTQELSIALALISAAIVNYTMEGKQKRYIKTAFKQYLSAEVIEKLVKDPEHLKLGGETRELSIFFSDVAGFTGISEVLGPEKLTALLNEYLTAMTDIIYDEGGTIDKYEGDAIIAFWNAPLDLKDHQVHAVQAAIRCNHKLAELRPTLKEKYGKDLFARVGINTGAVVVGNMGSKQRFNYTFLGDAGNLASRLEGLNKQFDTSILISECTYNMLGGEIPAREISSVRVVGRKTPIRVYEPMFREEYEAKADLTHNFSKALDLYYRGKFKEALPIFTLLSENDPPSSAYVKRCKDLIENAPENWDGVWAMQEK